MHKKVSLVSTVFLCALVCIISILGTIIVTEGQFSSKLAQYDAALKMYDILEYYEALYIGEFNSEEAQNIALKYLIAGTGDKYGYYYTPEEFQELMNSQTGNLVGIGVLVLQTPTEEGGIEINRVIPGSPAEKSGLLAGDIIVGVDNVKATPDNYNDIVNMIAGEVGSYVNITVKRGDEEKSFTIVRASIEFETVIWDYDEKTKTGVIRILEFIQNTPAQFTKAINDLTEKGAEYFVFDLRDNPGGLLDAVLSMMENLLPKDTLVTSLVKKNGAKQDYKTKVGNDFNYPMAVLINNNSASAAELFTSALRDHDKAVIIGETSYGKGVGQGVYPLNDGSAIKVTDFYYNPPCGENFNGVGIEPEYKISLDEDEKIDYYNIDFSDKVINKAIEILTEK